ncbi:glycoside hydrolase family 3 protein [Ornithobacterium rhinotracheale]|uniref:glycoside hydrolase family 3 protein n=1 Tax=Ornithobacterium rhinotracheale TaxID=28251 RepID=UPI00129D1000|nr:glycoside hydrolase family 3 N-terminal domain-containing protein [Ornithobacterium rhinotracheale]MRJ08504.1 glycoside hydrolase family 3 protein [Ornithobacterium rhinotracheale]UOH76779.1 glycoside hydrolase family 3 protein [Ornithobacterium rhinotracheale]
MNRNLAFCLFFLIFSGLKAQKTSPLYLNDVQIQWTDSLCNRMSLDEKVGQLFMVAAYTNKDLSHEKEIENLITKEKIGGLIFMQDNAEKQIELANRYQNLSKYPLLIGMDAEWGLAMRLKNTHRFPWAMTLGAVQNNDLVYQMGKKIAEHLAIVGAQFNFAPDIDVNVNPNNPIIGNRSFGSSPKNVAEKGFYYMKGMQDQRVLASAKHFPGHGDTDQDSHQTLPTIAHSKARLEAVELAPFKDLIQKGVTAIMVAHLNVPAFEKDPKKPASLSKNIVTHLLKEKMGFQGIIITDALNMSGVTKNFPNGESDFVAFEAGNDILLFSQAVSKGKQKIINAIKSGQISEQRLDESVRKILMAKYYTNLNHRKPLFAENLAQKLNDSESKTLNYQIFENAMTLLKNDKAQLPFSANEKIAWLPLGEENYETLAQNLAQLNIQKISRNQSDLKKFDKIFISFHTSNASPYASYKISDADRNLIEDLSQKNKVSLAIFGSPYALKNLETRYIESILVTYQNHPDCQEIVPEILFGKKNTLGKLPVDVKDFPVGSGLNLLGINIE